MRAYMVAVQLIESPNIISLQKVRNKFQAIDRSDLIDTILTSPQKNSIAPPAKYAVIRT